MSVEPKIMAAGNLEDSDMKGVSSLLKMKEGWKKKVVIGDGSGGGGKDKAEGLGFVLRGIDMNEGYGDENQPSDSDLNGSINHFGEWNNGGVNENGLIDNGKDPIAENPEKAIDDKDDEEVGDGKYSVGDFVWGKVKSHHSWWPGQIQDPSDASDYALKRKLLVAYFGDGTFAWCNSSQLRPIKENFEEMAKQSSSRSFLNAVEAAVDEIGRLMDSKMTCSCIPQDKRSAVDSPFLINGGLKDNARRVPKKLSISPLDLLTNLKAKAQTPNDDSNLLETVTLKSWVVAFYRSKGIYRLAECAVPKLIEGLEDQKEDNVVVMGKIRSRGPVEEEWLSNPKRKQRSIAEILQREMSKEANPIHKTKEVASVIKSAPMISKIGDSETKKKVEKKRKKDPVMDAEESCLMRVGSDTDSGLKGYASRERKKRKYLSPPYTNPPIKLERKIIDAVPSESVKISGVSGSEMPNPEKKQRSVDDPKDKTSAEDVLSEIQSLRVDPDKKTENFPLIEEFLHDFRSSVYSNDPKEKEEKKQNDGSIKSQVGKAKNNGGADPEIKSRNKRIKNSDDEDIDMDMPLINLVRSARKKASKSKLEKEKEEDLDLGARLLVSFGPGSSLPSEEDLINIYSKFGPLNDSKTKTYYNNFCGIVSFERTSDAESALASSKNSNPFGHVNASFVLRHLPSTPKKKPKPKPKPSVEEKKEKSEMEFVMKKLGRMSSLLEKSTDGKLSKKTMVKMEGELKGVLEKLSSASAGGAGGSSST